MRLLIHAESFLIPRWLPCCCTIMRRSDPTPQQHVSLGEDLQLWWKSGNSQIDDGALMGGRRYFRQSTSGHLKMCSIEKIRRGQLEGTLIAKIMGARWLALLAPHKPCYLGNDSKVKRDKITCSNGTLCDASWEDFYHALIIKWMIYFCLRNDGYWITWGQ